MLDQGFLLLSWAGCYRSWYCDNHNSDEKGQAEIGESADNGMR